MKIKSGNSGMPLQESPDSIEALVQVGGAIGRESSRKLAPEVSCAASRKGRRPTPAEVLSIVAAKLAEYG